MFVFFGRVLKNINTPGLCLLLVFCAVGLSAQGAFAARSHLGSDRVQGIAAVVNDALVSQKDVHERVDLLIAELQLSDTPDMRKQLIPKAVHDLVNEQLKYQAMEEKGISVSDADVRAAKRQIEEQHGLAKGAVDALLKEHDLRKDSLERRIRTDVGWVRYAQSVLRQQVSVDEKEVNAFLDSLRENLKHPQRLLAEIVLPVSAPKDEPNMRALAEQLIQQMRQGTPFMVLARRFSASATAAVGGDLGWVKEGSMPRPIEKVLEGMSPGRVSPPIRTANGYSIILFRDARQPQRLAPDRIRLKIDQAFIAGTNGRVSGENQKDMIVSRLRSEARSCGDVAHLAAGMLDRVPESDKELYTSGVREDISLSDLPVSMQHPLREASVRDVLGPFEVEGGDLVVMVCERQDVSGLPSYQDVENRLSLQKMERVSRRALQDLRRQAVIDIRL